MQYLRRMYSISCTCNIAHRSLKYKSFESRIISLLVFSLYPWAGIVIWAFGFMWLMCTKIKHKQNKKPKAKCHSCSYDLTERKNITKSGCVFFFYILLIKKKKKRKVNDNLFNKTMVQNTFKASEKIKLSFLYKTLSI